MGYPRTIVPGPSSPGHSRAIVPGIECSPVGGMVLLRRLQFPTDAHEPLCATASRRRACWQHGGAAAVQGCLAAREPPRIGRALADAGGRPAAVARPCHLRARVLLLAGVSVGGAAVA